MCRLNDETTSHFLLECQIFIFQKQELLRIIDSILLLNDMDNLNDLYKVPRLLYGHEKLNVVENREILKATINYIRQSGRFPKS